MKPSKLIVWLSVLIAVLALFASGVGLFYRDRGSPFTFTSLHGQEVKLFGDGIYRNEAFFKAPIVFGTDAVMFFLVVPLLLVALYLYVRGSLRGKLLLSAVLTCIFYVYASNALSAVYNNLFLVYIALFSLGFFALVNVLLSFDLQQFMQHVSPKLPNRRIAVFLFFAGMSVMVWLISIISGLAENKAPTSLMHYTTDITAVLDVGIICPTAYIVGILLWQRKPLGYLLANILIVLNLLVGIIVIGQTVAQSMLGITLSVGEYIGYVGTFVVMALFAVWMVVSYYRNISETVAAPAKKTSGTKLRAARI